MDYPISSHRIPPRPAALNACLWIHGGGVSWYCKKTRNG